MLICLKLVIKLCSFLRNIKGCLLGLHRKNKWIGFIISLNLNHKHHILHLIWIHRLCTRPYTTKYLSNILQIKSQERLKGQQFDKISQHFISTAVFTTISESTEKEPIQRYSYQNLETYQFWINMNDCYFHVCIISFLYAWHLNLPLK